MDPTTSTHTTHEGLSVLVLNATAQAAESVRTLLGDRSEIGVTSEIADLARGPELMAEHVPDLAVVALDGVTGRALAGPRGNAPGGSVDDDSGALDRQRTRKRAASTRRRRR